MNRFERLSRLSGYTVDKNRADPRGWDIVNPDHRSIGEVKDLIVDTATMKAVYWMSSSTRSSSTSPATLTS
jgi:hypothetical protein